MFFFFFGVIALLWFWCLKVHNSATGFDVVRSNSWLMALRRCSDLFAMKAILCALSNCLKCILTRFEPDLSAASRAAPHINPTPRYRALQSVPGNSDLGVFTQCGNGLRLHQRRPKVWWKLGIFAGDLSPSVSWRELFGALCVWTINLHQAPATDWDRQEVYSFSVTTATCLWPHARRGGSWSGRTSSATGPVKHAALDAANWVTLPIKSRVELLKNKQVPDPQVFLITDNQIRLILGFTEFNYNCACLLFPLSILLCVAAFLSSLGQYEIAIPVRTGPNGENQENPQHSRRRRRSTMEDNPSDSVLCSPTCSPSSFLALYSIYPATYR